LTWDPGTPAAPKCLFASLSLCPLNKTVLAPRVRELTCRVGLNKFIERETLASSLGDSGSGTFSESEGTDLKIGDNQKSFIISDSSYNNCNLVAESHEMLTRSFSSERQFSRPTLAFSGA
jgi:hypothetical protein